MKIFKFISIFLTIALFFVLTSACDGGGRETKDTTVEEPLEELDQKTIDLIVELAKSQRDHLTGNGPFAGIVWADSEYTYCDRFVSAVITVATGETVSEGYQSGYYTAYDDYIAHEDLIKLGEPPKGAVVYYGRHEENLNSGHVGISDGDGNVISVVNKTKGVDITPRNYFRAPLLGWVTFKEYKSEEEVMPSFKSLNFSGFEIPYPDWPVLAEEREDYFAQIMVGINKGSEALVSVGGAYGFLMPQSEQEKEDFEREFEEQGYKILNLQLNNNSMIVEATIKGEELDFEGAPFEIELYYSEVYHFFEYTKLGEEGTISFSMLTLENRWLDYKNIAKYITNAIDSLPLQPPVVEESEGAATAEEVVAEEESVVEKTLRPTSREKPATLGETILLTMDDWLIGEATVTFEIEMVDVVSGDDAWDMVRNANEFNDKPEAAEEYILAKFRFKIIETEYFFANITEEPLVIYHNMFRGIRGNGVEYPEWFYFSVLGLEPELNVVLYEGDECEGWTFFLVDKDDDNPLAVFEKGGSAETWFKLRP